MSCPEVSVIVPIYNREHDVAPLISALATQDYPRNAVEYLLVDNCSTDRTRDRIEAAFDAAENGGIAFRLLSEADIQSSYAARNTGIRAGIGSIFAFTDSDCRPRRDWLSGLVAAFADESVGVVAGQVDPLTDRGWIERYSTQRNAVSQQHTMNHQFRSYGQTANLAARREVLESVGMFRPYLRSGGDADLCWRATEAGWALAMATDAVVLHRHRSTVTALFEQYSRYASGAAHLSNLYGYPLAAPPTYTGYLRRDWPAVVRRRAAAAIRQRQPVLFSYALLDLVCFHARKTGLSSASDERLDAQIARLVD